MYIKGTISALYIYIYMYVCVCVCVCVFWQHPLFFIIAYFIEEYGHVLSTYFCICPFQLPNWFYGVRWELVDETPITNCYPSTFCPILNHHKECVYCKMQGKWLRVKQRSIKYHFFVFGMTWPGIEPRSLKPLANAVTVMSMGWYCCT